MKRCVVDASVIAAAFFREKQSEAARAALLSGAELHAPDLIYAEVANVAWKRRRRGEIDDREAADLVSDVLNLPLEITPSEDLVAAAIELALGLDRTVYDCLYLALAVQRKTKMLTGDLRLANAAAAGPLKSHVVWLGSLSS
jgi:predicted nucleic acid-binding protein